MKNNELDRKELAGRIAARMGKTVAEVQEFFEAYFAEFNAGLADSERIELHEHGTFRLKKAAARAGTAKGVAYSYPEGLRVTFKPQPALLKVLEAKTGKRVI